MAEGSSRIADRVPGRVMAARLALLRSDSAAAVDSLASIRPAGPLPNLVWRYWDGLAPERLLLARLLLARGRAAEAVRVAQSFDGSRAAVDVAFLRPSLELRREAAERLGNGNGVRDYTRRLEALRRR